MADLKADPQIIDALHNPSSLGGVNAVWKLIVDRLKHQGLAREIHLTPSQLGLHPCNRSKYGCHEDTVHELAKDIFEDGWDWNKVLGGVCVEDDQERSIEFHNQSMVKDSEYLAPVQPRSIVAGTLTNGHTVLLLRSILHGVPSSLPGISVNGRLCIDHVKACRPDMAKAAQEGWKWTMLSKD